MPKVLLYYIYTQLENPKAICRQQKRLCQQLGIKGRILISDQGLNGTISGSDSALEAYQEQTTQIPGCADIEWKVSDADFVPFPRLKVKVRQEVVTFGLKANGQDVSLKNSAAYIEPEELEQLYESGEDFLIIDARNEYESRIGKFKNALTPEIENFRELPEYTEKKLKKFKDKPVVTYCTGGIRCEKYSAFLKEQGFSNIKQLHGGIHNYADKTGGKHFEGEMYVFDARVHVPVNSVEPSVISQCLHCQQKIARYRNCSLPSCNTRIIICVECEEKTQRTCSKQCQNQVAVRTKSSESTVSAAKR